MLGFSLFFVDQAHIALTLYTHLHTWWLLKTTTLLLAVWKREKKNPVRTLPPLPLLSSKYFLMGPRRQKVLLTSAIICDYSNLVFERITDKAMRSETPCSVTCQQQTLIVQCHRVTQSFPTVTVVPSPIK